MFGEQKLWLEFVKSTKKVDFSSLKIQNSLNSDFWDADRSLNPEISQKLLAIANDFFNNLELEGVSIEDITFTGSLASYNWSKYSDIDLHIIVDFAKINENKDLVREFFNGKTFVWNSKHDISIFGYEVEIYVQNLDEPHHSLGVFSILEGKWLSEAVEAEQNIDFEAVKNKTHDIIDRIERIYDLYEDKKYQKSYNFGKKAKEKIKKMRKIGLESAGIYSIENLTFKMLRRSNYIGLLGDLINKSYDKLQSLSKNFAKKLEIYVSNDDFDEKKGFFRIEEIEKYQKLVRKRHSRMKKRLIGLGKQGPGVPYSVKISNKRADSAPPGAGGV